MFFIDEIDDVKIMFSVQISFRHAVLNTHPYICHKDELKTNIKKNVMRHFLLLNTSVTEESEI